MSQEELQDILSKHKLWLEDKEGGEQAKLNGFDLRDADLSDADLRDADLRGANIDYSCLPLWYGGLHVKIDNRQAIQILYHLLSCISDNDNITDEVKSVLLTDELAGLANKFHLVDECGEIGGLKNDN